MNIKPALSPQALAQLFNDAHTPGGWLDVPVAEATLRELYALACMGPTSMNCQPMRLVFVSTPEAKERLIATLSPGNVDKVRQAPVTAIVAYDTQFFELMPQVWHGAGTRDMFANNPALASITTTRNGSLGGGYFIAAARALGLDCGPMSGFDNAKLDAEFFADGRFKSNFICCLGVGDPAKARARNPRLSFEQACQVV
jgi:3-hydroxypropanoate dehydrogenase